MSQVVSFPGLGLSFEISPIVFSIGNFSLRWYGVIIAFGLVAGLFSAYSKSKTVGIIPDKMLDVLMVSIVGAVVGARLYYVIFSLNEYTSDWLKIFRVWEGGLAIYGGVIGGIVAAYFACKWTKVAFKPMLDLGGLGLLIGQAIGRWGNFVNQEAFGTNTTLPWGMTSQTVSNYLTSVKSGLAMQGINVDPSLPVHPCFLYESIWCLIGFGLLYWYIEKRRFDGEVFLFYVGWYGLGRFVIEGFRTDSLMLGSIRVSQFLALICVFVALWLVVSIRSKIRRNGDPDYLPLYVTTEGYTLAVESYEKELRDRADKKNGSKELTDTEKEEPADSSPVEEKNCKNEKAEENTGDEKDGEDTDGSDH